MANRTVKDAHSVKGTNPQYLVEKITRTRIYESRYWKEECFALTAELMVDKAMELKYIGGVYGGNIKPTPFLCLILKMLQIQPDKDIIVEFISNADFKYVRALGALYMRLVGTSLDCYKYLEPLYNDYRKLKKQNRDGSFEMLYMDEYIDQLLREERMFDIILPRVQKRPVLEETNQLEPRVSFLDEEMEEMDTSDEEEGQNQHKSPEREPSPADARASHRNIHRAKRSPSPQHRRNRSRSPHGRSRRGERERERGDRGDRERRRSRSRSRDRHREKKRRSRSRSRDRDRGHKRQESDESRRRHHKSKKSKHERRDKEEKEKGLPQEDLEIKEANELRAKLGLPPLRP